MAYEIINIDPVTPHRLHALVRLVDRMEVPKRKEVIDLLQPPELGLNQDTAKDVILAAKHLRLVNEESDGILSLTISSNQINTIQSFRNLLLPKMLGIIEEGNNNYIFNLASAWYAVQNETVFNASQFRNSAAFANALNSQLFPGVKPQRFDDHKFEGFRDWAAFLGLGWILRSGSSNNSRVILVPDAYGRLETVLDEILTRGPQVRFGEFIEHLGQRCPELDGGSLFEYCWKVCNPGERRSNTLSLMLSNALYQLHAEGKIVLQRSGDALENWQLFPAAGQSMTQVSHIYRGEN